MNQALGIDNKFKQTRYAVDNIHCGNCVRTIETKLATIKGIKESRVNLTTGRVAVWADQAIIGEEEIAETLTNIGFQARPLPEDSPLQTQAIKQERSLIMAMAVAGFGFANVMLLSVSIWSGDATGIDPFTRALLQAISGVIAIPCIGFAGLPFFLPAIAALRVGRVNMDVPISVALLLIVVLGLMVIMGDAEANQHVETYFDSALALEFFLLLGRVMEANIRKRVWDSAGNLLAFLDRPVKKITNKAKLNNPKDHIQETSLINGRNLITGDWVALADGDLICADGMIIEGEGQIDMSSLTGESLPVFIHKGMKVKAGAIFLSGQAIMEVESSGYETELANLQTLVEKAAGHRAHYSTLADKAATIYTPVVHVIAALALVVALWFGKEWQDALIYAASVLIITCPCALALAIPAAQAAAVNKLFSQQILVKSGGALERLADVTYALIDKTGTLSEPMIKPKILDTDINANDQDSMMKEAASLAIYGRHPLCTALAKAYPQLERREFHHISDQAGLGLSGFDGSDEWRLGSAEFCGVTPDEEAVSANKPSMAQSYLWFTTPNHPACKIEFVQIPREGAKACLEGFNQNKIDYSLLSGDNHEAVESLAKTLGIKSFYAGLTPLEKVRKLKNLKEEWQKIKIEKNLTDKQVILAFGDGSNDAGMLAEADVSIALSTGTPLSQSIADIVIPTYKLAQAPKVIELAKKAKRIAFQNLGFAVCYNLVAIPLAFFGYASPLVAAIAMSSSSVIVVSNALRVRYGKF